MEKNTISQVKARYYHEALADILTWIDGYCAGTKKGKEHLRNVNVEALLELKIVLQAMDWYAKEKE